MADFQMHPGFEATTFGVGDLQLCHVRLQADVRWPWLILIPRRPGLMEIDSLGAEDRVQLMEEQVRAMRAVRAVGEARGRPVSKLNVAALGNVTPQLHVHVIGRRTDDAAWPQPVWGVGTVQPYSDGALIVALTTARDALEL